MTNETNWKKDSILSRWSEKCLTNQEPSKLSQSVRGRKWCPCHCPIPRVAWWRFSLPCPVFLFTDPLVDGSSSLQKVLGWVFSWQLRMYSLSLWDLCLWTWIMRAYELATELLCFCFSLANLRICVYLIFISHCSVSIGRERKMFDISVLQPHFIEEKRL